MPRIDLEPHEYGRRLKMQLALILLFSCGATGKTIAESFETTGYYLAHSSDPAARSYLAGLAEGYEWANATVTNRGDKPIVCIPFDLSLTDADVDAILRAYLVDEPEHMYASSPLGLTIAMAPEQRFPSRGLNHSTSN